MTIKYDRLSSLSPAGYAFVCSTAALLGCAVAEPFFQEGGSLSRVGIANAFLCPTVTGLIATALVFADSADRRNTAESTFLSCSAFGVVFAASFLLMIPSQVVFAWFSPAGNSASSFSRGTEIMSLVTGRAISWSVFAAGIVAVIIVVRKPGLFAALITGTLVSGAISGLLFDPIQALLSGNGGSMPWVSRLVCFSIFGGLVGLFFGMAKNLSKDGELLITSGKLAGNKLVLDSGPCLIGSSPECDLVLPKRDFRNVSALIQRAGFGFRFYVFGGESDCSLNNRRVRSAKLRAGDHLRIGETNMIFSDGR